MVVVFVVDGIVSGRIIGSDSHGAGRCWSRG